MQALGQVQQQLQCEELECDLATERHHSKVRMMNITQTPHQFPNPHAYMLSEAPFVNSLLHWHGATSFFAEDFNAHNCYLAWCYTWDNNKGVAASPLMPADETDPQYQWWPVLVGRTIYENRNNPRGPGVVAGYCPALVRQRSQAWWWNITRLRGARNPELAGCQPPPPPAAPPAAVPPGAGPQDGSDINYVVTPGVVIEEVDDEDDDFVKVD